MTPVRVCSVPAAHPYVQHLAHPGPGPGRGVPVVRLDDPPVPGAPAGRWWPPVALEADWVRAHADEFDVHHVHFGFEGRTTSELVDLVAALREVSVPLVLTVHDLTNPHLEDQTRHDEQLDVLVPAAAAVLTLTPAAAREVRRRWGRDAVVVPHPHVVPVDVLDRPRPPRSGSTVVGLHLKSLRAGLDRRALPVLVRACDRVPGARVRVDLHAEVLGRPLDGADASLVAWVRAAADEGRLDLVVHERFSDDELWDYVQALDVSVLPYVVGTHSGWVEMCHDLGTAVVASDAGLWAEQQPVATYRTGASGPDEQSLVVALQQALSPGSQPRADPEERLEQRRAVADAHAEVYAAVLAGGRL